nr:Lrp/AsnC family transcriptional regulator [Desulforamulus aquiferis]
MKNINLNSLDYKLINILLDNGRVTWSELGDSLGLSAPAAAERVRRLEDKGIIKGYSAIVDPELLSFEIVAFISVTLDRPENRGRFLENILRVREIQECHHVAGEEDYLLKVRCTKIKNLEKLISEVLKEIPGVGKTKTTIVLSSEKETSKIPIPSSK